MTKSFENGGLRRPASWQRKVSRRHVLIVLGLLAAFNVIFYFLAVYPLDAREEQRQAMIAGLGQQVAAKTSEVEKLRLIAGKVEQARTEGDSLLQTITLERNTTFSKLVAELVAAASESRVETRESNFDLQPVEGAEQYGAITITANFRGEYANLVQFLNRLDKSEQFLIIESLGATPRSDSTELQITMKIDTFVRDL
jgi:Tfp pilus assembly protein PilO